MANVIVTPTLLTGYNTASYAQPTIASATPVAWTTANSPITLWTVTGSVLARVFGIVGATALTSTGGLGTLSVGVAGNVQLFLPTTTVSGVAAAFDPNNVWVDASPTQPGEVLVAANLTGTVISGAVITLTVATANMTAGAMTLFCLWTPLSAGATVV